MSVKIIKSRTPEIEVPENEPFKHDKLERKKNSNNSYRHSFILWAKWLCNGFNR